MLYPFSARTKEFNSADAVVALSKSILNLQNQIDSIKEQITKPSDTRENPEKTKNFWSSLHIEMLLHLYARGNLQGFPNMHYPAQTQAFRLFINSKIMEQIGFGEAYMTPKGKELVIKILNTKLD